MRIVLCPTPHEHDREVSLLERLMHGHDRRRAAVLPEESQRGAADAAWTTVTASSSSTRARRSTSASRPCRPRTPPAPTRRSSTCSSSATAGSPRSPARAAGWRPRSACAATARALAAAGVLPDPELVVESNFNVDGGLEAAAALLDLAEPPTAIFAFNDQLAIGAMQAAPRARASRARGPLGGRLRRHRRGRARHPGADDRAPAARRDGPDGGQPARAPAREPAARGAARRARRRSWSCANRRGRDARLARGFDRGSGRRRGTSRRTRCSRRARPACPPSAAAPPPST